jgi:hypothetical protein
MILHANHPFHCHVVALKINHDFFQGFHLPLGDKGDEWGAQMIVLSWPLLESHCLHPHNLSNQGN